MTSVTPAPLRPSLAQSLLKIWIKQRQLLRVMDRQREAPSLHASAFAVELVTDGYYLIRKNLSDLTALHCELPLAAANAAPAAIPPPASDQSGPAAQRTPHDILAEDIAALNAIAADYADLHTEAVSAQAAALGTLVLQHSRQLKEFLTNLFPDHATA